ncbi:MAG: ribosomal L7Ae/L30e/S12e/Gadd45 family protein [Nanoarchaeota archaeon]|nr:ribosomal L7Ae/L30e/S12e/Gadd45 family protein [Nanoarchaeota archaeon]
MADESSDKILEIVELARKTGKIKKGSNEATKALERGTAKLVVTASDVNPKEVIMHLPLLAKEKGIPHREVPKKDDLGAAAGLQVGTAAIAILSEGEAKKQIAELK